LREWVELERERGPRERETYGARERKEISKRMSGTREKRQV